jgi:hypothetical protein
VHLHPQHAGPKILSSLNGQEKVAISGLRVLLIVCVPDLGIEAVKGIYRKGPTFLLSSYLAPPLLSRQLA